MSPDRGPSYRGSSEDGQRTDALHIAAAGSAKYVRGVALTAVVEVESLHKSYRQRRGGKVRALDGLELSVRAGGVFGFLGPNGSGKTTTIRCLLGLARPSSGRCRVLGAESPARLPDVVGRLGALVEGPGLNPGLSGRQALTVLATTAGLGRHAVDANLERVGPRRAGGRSRARLLARHAAAARDRRSPS